MSGRWARVSAVVVLLSALGMVGLCVNRAQGGETAVCSLDVTGSGSGASVACGSVAINGTSRELPWSETVSIGSSVTLAAVPSSGWRFAQWGGAASGTESPVTIVISADALVEAAFAPVISADVPQAFWAYREVMACVAAGIVEGYEDGLYRPEVEVDRGAMAVYIARALAGGESNVPAGPAAASFADVPPCHWCSKHIEYVSSRKVVEGYRDGNYHPEWNVNRAQMAVFIARAIVEPAGEEGLSDYAPPLTPTFSDVVGDSWCYKHVEYLAAGGVAGGYPDGAYHPEDVVTRDQMAVYVARAFGLD